MKIIMPPADDEQDELTFFIEGHHSDSPNHPLTFLVRALSAEEAREGLASRGYICKAITQATSPTDTGFQIRLDGTVLVTIYHKTSLIGIYGPFNDEADAQRWILLRTDPTQHAGLRYLIREPIHCFRIGKVNNVATILTLPDNFFTSPL